MREEEDKEEEEKEEEDGWTDFAEVIAGGTAGTFLLEGDGDGAPSCGCCNNMAPVISDRSSFLSSLSFPLYLTLLHFFIIVVVVVVVFYSRAPNKELGLLLLLFCPSVSSATL